MSTLPERETIISSLKRVCEEDPNVRMAFLFGSFASERDIPESDIDIAVYLGDPENYNKLWGKPCYPQHCQADDCLGGSAWNQTGYQGRKVLSQIYAEDFF